MVVWDEINIPGSSINQNTQYCRKMSVMFPTGTTFELNKTPDKLPFLFYCKQLALSL